MGNTHLQISSFPFQTARGTNWPCLSAQTLPSTVIYISLSVCTVYRSNVVITPPLARNPSDHSSGPLPWPHTGLGWSSSPVLDETFELLVCWISPCGRCVGWIETHTNNTRHILLFCVRITLQKNLYIYIYIDLFSDAHLRPAATSRHGNGLCSVALYHFGEVCQECIGSNVWPVKSDDRKPQRSSRLVPTAQPAEYISVTLLRCWDDVCMFLVFYFKFYNINLTMLYRSCERDFLVLTET